ncbi:hypothetical protein LIER_42789 [Lithospermum erythrorhizon]|uniref:Uncharacterized protein n=1 Tax=Lithospermum erythrorhizon TaxID=34254 RepID=A0AAV3NXT8_LITER
MDMVEDGLNLRHGETRFDLMRCSNDEQTGIKEAPNAITRAYYNLVGAINQPLFDGCTKFTKLSMPKQLVSLKPELQISQEYFQHRISLIKRWTPKKGENIFDYFYEAKRLLSLLFLPKQKIHACVNNFMSFYKEDGRLEVCRFCGENRYGEGSMGQRKPVARKVLIYLPLGARLQQLYTSRNTAHDMTWHHRTQTDDGWMTHPRNGATWKHLDATYLFFSEPRNIRIGLCSNGFSSFSKFGRQYSCWPFIICVEFTVGIVHEGAVGNQ